MNWTRIGIVVLSSGWFFLASCTAGMIVGTRIVAAVDARTASDGDDMHSTFSAVAPSSESDVPFVVLDWADVKRGKELAGSYLMPRPYAEIETRVSYYSYEVLEESQAGQIIEVIEKYKDGDNTIWSRYQATQTSITPISSRMFYFGYAFVAMPYAFGFAFVLYLAGRVLAYRNRDPATKKAGRSSVDALVFIGIFGVGVVALYFISTPTETDDFTGSTARNFTIAGIVTEHKDGDSPYRVLNLERLNSDEFDISGITFLLPKPDITINVGDIHHAQILEDHGDWQLVKFNYANTRTSTTIYRAYVDHIEPVSYRLTSSVGHLAMAVGWFLVSLLLTGIAMWRLKAPVSEASN